MLHVRHSSGGGRERGDRRIIYPAPAQPDADDDAAPHRQSYITIKSLRVRLIEITRPRIQNTADVRIPDAHKRRTQTRAAHRFQFKNERATARVNWRMYQSIYAYALRVCLPRRSLLTRGRPPSPPSLPSPSPVTSKTMSFVCICRRRQHDEVHAKRCDAM